MTWEAKLKNWLETIPQAQARLALSVLLVILIVYLLANFTLLLLPKEQSKGQWQPPKSGSASAQQKRDVGLLQELALFGQADAAKPIQVKPAKAPKTKLNLKLTGLVASRDPKKGSVVIDSKGKQATYGVDDRIDGTRAVVKEIYPDRVMISNGGKLEALMLDDYDGAQFTAQSPAAKTTKTNRDRSNPKKVKRKPNARLSEALQEVKSAQGADKLAKLTDYIKVSPVRDEGQLKGFRVNPGKDREVFNATGLRPGDLAVGLNGYDLTDMSQSAQVMQELKNMDSLSLSVERDGQLYEFLFELPSQ